MSSLWTPGGERPVGRDAPPQAQSTASTSPFEPDGPIDEAELEARMAELRDQLAHTPVAGIVAQVAYQLFEVAALHLSLQPPQLGDAQLAIDAMAALVEGLGDRLGEHDRPLREGLSQLQMAFVQIKNQASTPPPQPPPSAPADQAPPQS